MSVYYALFYFSGFLAQLQIWPAYFHAFLLTYTIIYFHSVYFKGLRVVSMQHVKILTN